MYIIYLLYNNNVYRFQDLFFTKYLSIYNKSKANKDNRVKLFFYFSYFMK